MMAFFGCPTKILSIDTKRQQSITSVQAITTHPKFEVKPNISS